MTKTCRIYLKGGQILELRGGEDTVFSIAYRRLEGDVCEVKWEGGLDTDFCDPLWVDMTQVAAVTVTTDPS